jgi:enoyl-CoA hydratase
MNSIQLTHFDHYSLLTIIRGKSLNALNAEVFQEIDSVISSPFPASTRLLVVTGEGEKAFAAGADIAEFKGMTVEEGKALAKKGHKVFNKIETSPKPIIAAVNGFALGGGCELAMACHIRIASENAKFGQPEVNLGLIPGYGGTQRMVQLIGKGKAIELLMTGDIIDAVEAQKLGLSNQVVQTVELLDICKGILKKISTKSPYAISKVIESVYAHFKDGMDGFDTEIELFGQCVGTEDFVEGTSAFIEKRKAKFTGK